MVVSIVFREQRHPFFRSVVHIASCCRSWACGDASLAMDGILISAFLLMEIAAFRFRFFVFPSPWFP